MQFRGLIKQIWKLITQILATGEFVEQPLNITIAQWILFELKKSKLFEGETLQLLLSVQINGYLFIIYKIQTGSLVNSKVMVINVAGELAKSQVIKYCPFVDVKKKTHKETGHFVEDTEEVL